MVNLATLEEISRGTRVEGIVSGISVEIVDVKWQGTSALSVIYRDSLGHTGDALLFRAQEANLKIVGDRTCQRSFDADGTRFRLVSEAYRIKLAHLFDPLLAVHTSLVRPLPHQITAVYEEMIPRQPLRFLLADDPGAGKTIMAGLLMKELIARGDLTRCLVVSPGSIAEQWQEEMGTKFGLPFQIITNELIEGDLSGNPFATYNFVIGRLDHLSRNEEIQAKIKQTDWDLIVVDEAHKMSCPWYGNEAKPTKRFALGRLLSTRTRHLLLMTATPHNGKEEDFQSFLQLIDQDRFEGRPRKNQRANTEGIMRRMTKEKMVTFENTPIFPERKAYAPQYDLMPEERELYNAVTDYVANEMNRVDRLEKKRGIIVGFAMAVLQRRLASSPEAIYQSLKRRYEKLKEKLKEITEGKKTQDDALGVDIQIPWDIDEGDDEDVSDYEREDSETEIISHVTAAQTIRELEAEIQTLRELNDQAKKVRSLNEHGKWNELSNILRNQPELFDNKGHRRKLIIFTEHKDTLNYLAIRIRSLIGKPQAVVTIHGGMTRENRRFTQGSFINDKNVFILVATDAAGEGVNLQRAHLMINYDLPWNPNRLEQRFGRIHRIGQTEVCHMWNLVAKNTREGDVFQRLFEKLQIEAEALGGRVFDVLGRAIESRELRDLLIEAIRYGNRPEVKAKLYQKVDEKLDRKYLQELLEERVLAHDSMDTVRVQKIKEDMERAEARRLQPYFIETFFLKAFKELGGSWYQRETRRYEIKHVPLIIRQRASEIGLGRRLQQRYERISFEKDLIQVQGAPTAEFVCPGHLLLDATINLLLEQNRDILERGSILIDPEDPDTEPRALWFIQSEILDGRKDTHGNMRVVGRQMHFVEMTPKNQYLNAGYAPYLDYRPLTPEEKDKIEEFLTPTWLSSLSEEKAIEYASNDILPPYFEEVRRNRKEMVEKTKKAVFERLTKAISYWDRRANELKEQELRGRKTKLSSGNARRKADELEERKKIRIEELEKEKHLIPRTPIIVGGAIVIPQGLLDRAQGRKVKPPTFSKDRERVERLAMEKVIEVERRLGREPKDVSSENIGYDIESKDSVTGKLYFIEVKGRTRDADSITVTKNEIITALNMPDSYFVAIVIIDESGASEPYYVREPFKKEPDFDATGVIYNLKNLIERAEVPSNG